MAIELSTLQAAFEGMASRESVSHQVKYWAKGIPLHNPVRDECCPDFSCCNGGSMMPVEARKRLEQAHLAGDEETVQAICMSGLSGLVADIGGKVHIAGEDHTVH